MTTAQDGGTVVNLTYRPPLPPGNAPGTHFCWRQSRPQGHSAIGRILCQWKIHWHQLRSNQWPSDLKHSALTTVPPHTNSFREINIFILNLLWPACQVRWCPLAFSNSLLTLISTWWPVIYVTLTFALTFSKDAGFTSEKQMRNTSCKKTNQKN